MIKFVWGFRQVTNLEISWSCSQISGRDRDQSKNVTVSLVNINRDQFDSIGCTIHEIRNVIWTYILCILDTRHKYCASSILDLNNCVSWIPDIIMLYRGYQS